MTDDEIPLVCFIDDVCRILRVSRRVVERLRRQRVFPIPELPALDRRPRWSREAVETFLQTDRSGLRTMPRPLTHRRRR